MYIGIIYNKEKHCFRTRWGSGPPAKLKWAGLSPREILWPRLGQPDH